MIQCGANVNGIHNNWPFGRPLHAIATCSNIDIAKPIIELFLAQGAHADSIDSRGNLPQDLASQPAVKELLRSTRKLSLKCRCAQIIVSTRINYQNYLSSNLVIFQDMSSDVNIGGSGSEINLSPRASWNQTGITIIGSPNGTAGSSLFQLSSPYGISIVYNDVLYISDTANDRIVVVDLDHTDNVSFIGSGPGTNLGEFDGPFGISTTNTSLYVIDFGNDRVQKMLLNGSNPIRIPGITHFNRPHYLFVDNNDNIYLSDTFNHTVLLFLPNSTNGTIVAGGIIYGSNDDQLFFPNGIFVNSNGTLYIADHQNHRIMKWFSGASSGVRVAGNGTGGSSLTQLYLPMDVIVDTNEYMYISDAGNSRVMRWIPNSTYGDCIIGCTGTSGVASTQLNYPVCLAFDSKGSLYVNDYANNRIQKFQYQVPFYNQPKFSPCALWNSTVITFANSNIIGTNPYDLFIDTSNTVYILEKSLDRVQIWTEGDTIPTRNISNSMNDSFSIFVTSNGDIYIDNGSPNHRVDRWINNATNSTPAMYVQGTCYSLFVDSNNSFYCSLGDLHKVIKRSAYNEINQTTIVAGNGAAGLGSNMLNSPRGIFVDIKFNLYVADCINDRVQLFQFGQLNGTTVVGYGANKTIDLDCPVGIVFDDDGYIFISDSQNNRIIGSSSNGFRCIIGCASTSGFASNQLHHPQTISFDSYGNLYVVDVYNDRIQKFLLTSNTCVQQSSPSFFVTFTCPNTTAIGLNCNTSSNPCDILRPCENNGTCNDINTTISAYNCSCPSGFVGTQCQIDNRPCKSNTCWNNGICNETSTTTFHCSCATGWEGINCETKIDYCHDIVCQNNGICRSSYLNYTCECLGDNYSGRYCEITSNKAATHQRVSKSIGFIAIIAMISTAMFIIIMDILKYCFGVDPISKKRKDTRKQKQSKKRKHPGVCRYARGNRSIPRPIKPSIPTIVEAII
ncbi:unnamed protein product [Adineta steineri]|uniref:EGF-like domain-containing protein n=2 Tax=Adineta steineri TaxID=433720 RepID=A0A819IYH2_9BILA|nr:unnamed protein product [Adineta steineri]